MLTAPWPPPLAAEDLAVWPAVSSPVSPAGSPGSSRGVPHRSDADRPIHRAVRWIAPLVALLLVLGSLALDRSGLVVLPVLFILVVPFEKMFPRHQGQRLRRPGLRGDIAHALAAPLLGTVGVAVAIVVGVLSLAWLPGLLLRPVVGLLPAAVLPFAGIALFDLATYWVHRWSHEVPLLWKFHSVHHSTEHLDWVSGFRNHPIDGAIAAPPFFLLIAAGFDATFTGALAIIQIVTGLFLHANVRWRWRPLHRIVITPEFHHWHHANERDAHNSNYSVFLPLWDTVFGTYFMPTDRRPEVYGIDGDMPLTLVGQLRHPFRGVVDPWTLAQRSIRHPWRAVRRLGRGVRSLLIDIRHSTTRRTM